MPFLNKRIEKGREGVSLGLEDGEEEKAELELLHLGDGNFYSLHI